jgi:hypothetical protein
MFFALYIRPLDAELVDALLIRIDVDVEPIAVRRLFVGRSKD